jgi:hypothetical protein
MESLPEPKKFFNRFTLHVIKSEKTELDFLINDVIGTALRSKSTKTIGQDSPGAGTLH